MNVKLVISEATLRAALETENGRMVIGTAEQFFPESYDKEMQPALELFVSDIMNENGMMSVLVRKLEIQNEMLASDYTTEGKKYILAQKALRFRKEGKGSL